MAKLEALPQHSITVRKIATNFARAKRHWAGGNPFSTHLINALSFTFPVGERQFVAAVRHYASQIKDPVLQRDVRSFIGQEGNHAATHQELNDWIVTQVKGADQMLAKLTAQMIKQTKYAQKAPKVALALTVAAEHLTAVLASQYLRHEDLVEMMDPAIRGLTIWHSIEEVEHRAVAFDVYQAVGGSYGMRVAALLAVTAGITLKTSLLVTQLLLLDGELNNRTAFREFMQILFGRGGYLAGVAPAYMKYFSPDFHPKQSDDDELVAMWTARLEALTEVRALSRKGDSASVA